MLTSSCWGCIRNRHLSGVLAISSHHSPNLRKDLIGLPTRSYAKEKDTCCQNIPQTKGRDVQPWPKQYGEQHPPWRAECPCGPAPPNYDPYRIKVPDVVVPPLDPKNVKDPQNELFTNSAIGVKGAMRDLFHNSSVVHPDYWKEKVELKHSEVPESYSTVPRLGYHGRSKYKYAFHEPWKPLDRLTLMAEAEQEEKDKKNQYNMNTEDNTEPPEKINKIL